MPANRLFPAEFELHCWNTGGSLVCSSCFVARGSQSWWSSSSRTFTPDGWIRWWWSDWIFKAFSNPNDSVINLFLEKAPYGAHLLLGWWKSPTRSTVHLSRSQNWDSIPGLTHSIALNSRTCCWTPEWHFASVCHSGGLCQHGTVKSASQCSSQKVQSAAACADSSVTSEAQLAGRLLRMLGKTLNGWDSWVFVFPRVHCCLGLNVSHFHHSSQIVLSNFEAHLI